MIIDLILDKKDGLPYNPREFYKQVKQYGKDIQFTDISDAMQEKNEYKVKQALCRYIVEFDYNLDIIKYILKVNWL